MPFLFLLLVLPTRRDQKVQLMLVNPLSLMHNQAVTQAGMMTCRGLRQV